MDPLGSQTSNSINHSLSHRPTRLAKTPNSPFERVSQSVDSLFLNRPQSSERNHESYDLTVLRATMTDPQKIGAMKMRDIRKGFDYGMTENDLGSASEYFDEMLDHLRLGGHGSFDDTDDAMGRLYDAMRVEYGGNGKKTLLFLKPLIDGSLEKTSTQYKEALAVFKVQLEAKLNERYKSKNGTNESPKDLEVFEQLGENLLDGLRKFYTIEDPTNETEQLFRNLIEKTGSENILKMYEHLIRSEEEVGYKKLLVIGMVKACGAQHRLLDIAYDLSAESFQKNPDIDFSSNFRLTEAGIEVILEQLKKKKPAFEQLSTTVCLSLDDLADGIKKMILEKQEKGFFFAKTLERHFHMSSVYVEKDEKGDYDMVVVDSADHTNFAAGYIRLALPENTHLTLHYGLVSRQKDHVNCAVFCLRDFTQFAQYSEGIMQFVRDPERSGSVLEDRRFVKVFNSSTSVLEDISEHLPISSFIFNVLPPQLMKLAQSLKALVQYEDTHHIPVGLNMRHIKEKVVGSKAKNMVNAKVTDFAWKYHMLILRTSLEQRRNDQ